MPRYPQRKLTAEERQLVTSFSAKQHKYMVLFEEHACIFRRNLAVGLPAYEEFRKIAQPQGWRPPPEEEQDVVRHFEKLCEIQPTSIEDHITIFSAAFWLIDHLARIFLSFPNHIARAIRAAVLEHTKKHVWSAEHYLPASYQPTDIPIFFGDDMKSLPASVKEAAEYARDMSQLPPLTSAVSALDQSRAKANLKPLTWDTVADLASSPLSSQDLLVFQEYPLRLKGQLFVHHPSEESSDDVLFKIIGYEDGDDEHLMLKVLYEGCGTEVFLLADTEIFRMLDNSHWYKPVTQ